MFKPRESITGARFMYRKPHVQMNYCRHKNNFLESQKEFNNPKRVQYIVLYKSPIVLFNILLFHL